MSPNPGLSLPSFYEQVEFFESILQRQRQPVALLD
jgi:hypothetical protein